jgi:uncharacterized membrane protein YidH (DUF202 family)
LHGNESIARLLGYAGLAPFVTFSLGCWVPLPFVTDALSVLIAYAAIILSFMGAIHWGIAMSTADKGGSYHLIISVIPALVAWVALIMPAAMGLATLILGFIALYLYDVAVEEPQGLPGWYIPMRRNLTIVVTPCLAVAFMSVVLP